MLKRDSSALNGGPSCKFRIFISTKYDGFMMMVMMMMMIFDEFSDPIVLFYMAQISEDGEDLESMS